MPSLRIHFSPRDLARTRLARGADPLWELVLSTHILRSGQAMPGYASWRDMVRERLRDPPGRRLGAATRVLAGLVPTTGNFPDFLTPVVGTGSTTDIGGRIEQVVATPRAELVRDVAEVFTRRSAPEWVGDLVAGRTDARHLLSGALRIYHDRLVASHDRTIEAAVHVDRILRARQLLDGGVEALLDSLPDPLQWRSPSLVTSYVYDRDLYLDGRGITLIPSYFCHGNPVTYIDSELPPVLVYPAAAAGLERPGPADGLAAVVGHTRALVLAALRISCSTSELADRVGTSIASASKHAAALRSAGLVDTVRHGRSVLHTLTPTGEALLGATEQRPNRAFQPGENVIRA